jgi:hypothetical protein
MVALLHLSVIGPFLFNGIFAHDASTLEPYRNPSLEPAKRADDLLKRLTWEEKIGQMGGIRAAFTSVNGSVAFNRTSFERIRSTQNGQIGKS